MSPIIEMVEEHRELAKLQNTYIDVLPTLVNAKTGRIHSTFNQAVASTGRLSSMDPNLQNIPIRTELGREVRRAFWAEEGNVLIAADYSQIELRIVAALAEDAIMIEVFKNGEDIHRATAAVINGVPLAEVTKEMRSAAKAINFGVLYGQGAYGLSAQTGMTQFEAKEFIAKYFEKFEGVKKYMDAVLEKAKETGYVETFFGRRRYIPELNSQNFQLRNSGERMAINMPVQGTAADIMKLGMIEMYKRLRECKEWASGEIKMILQVHDEIVVEAKEGLEEKVSAIMKKAMEEVIELSVPIVVEVSVGKRWGDLK
jgi:DNA polymerase-1